MGTNVLMGQDVCEQIEAQASIRGASKIMLVTDEGLVKAGIVDKVLAHIDKSKFEVTIFDEVKPDPSVKVVDKGAAIASQKGIDLIIAVGGGSPIDAGKGISVVATNGGSSANYEWLDSRQRRAKPPSPVEQDTFSFYIGHLPCLRDTHF